MFGIARKRLSHTTIADQPECVDSKHRYQVELSDSGYFSHRDLKDWKSAVALMNTPVDASSLALLRILFGLLMIVDCFQERGMLMAVYRWGDNDECRFPLFNFLKPLSLRWMYIVYLAQLSGASGMMVGLCYRLSCILFLIPYWYIVLLDKTTWNNHSYLFGLLGILFLCTNANKKWALDNLCRRKIQNKSSSIPLWNYILFRAQIFILYFIAGLKKMDMDWVSGYSMQDLSKHWIFKPFQLLLTEAQIDLYVIHIGGLLIDLFTGFALSVDVTRPAAILLSSAFHIMNSRIFEIGMFPYAMIALTPIFCQPRWPVNLMSQMRSIFNWRMNVTSNLSSHSRHTRSKNTGTLTGPSTEAQKPTCVPVHQHIAAAGTLMYIAIQLFLPYSHFLTPGYNTWTSGLYGYSWDMMVHNWNIQHVNIRYVDKKSGSMGFLRPEAWSKGMNRWSSQANMVKQYAMCIKDKLQVSHNLSSVELYFDVWISMNNRFQQRIFNPNVDIVAAEWGPFKATSWVQPLLLQFSDWREIFNLVEEKRKTDSSASSVTFIADFPGLILENYIQPDLESAEIEVLEGAVVVQILNGKQPKYTLNVHDKMKLPCDVVHKVHTVSTTPSCLMFTFINKTQQRLDSDARRYQQLRVEYVSKNKTDFYDQETQRIWMEGEIKRLKQERISNAGHNSHRRLLTDIYKLIHKMFVMVNASVMSIVLGKSIEAVLAEAMTITAHDSE